MKTCKSDYRTFTHSGEAWYHSLIGGFSLNTVDEVYFGLSCGDGGTHGEMKMEWITLGGKACPQLQVFDDAWVILLSFTDLLAELAKFNCESMSNRSITPKEFCAILLRLGFRDTTIRENPNPTPPPATREERLERALHEALAWMPHHDKRTPEERGAKCDTLSDALGLIANAFEK